MRIVLMIVGLLSLGIGAVGVALPVLPTTPFLLVAALCFAKSSERLNCWFKSTSLYKNNLETLSRGQGMTWKSKIRIMSTVTIVMGIAFVAMKNTEIGRICLAAVWILHVVAFCFVIKTYPEDQQGNAEGNAHDD